MKFSICISLLLLSTLTFAKNTSVLLKDSCSGKQTSLYTYNGMNIIFNIKEFNPYDKMTIKVEFYPTRSTEEKVNTAAYSIKYHYSEANQWNGIFGNRLTLPKKIFNVRVKTPKKKRLRRLERKLQASKLWTVRISWTQPNSRLGGVAQKSFMNIRNEKNFYEILSPGLCHWETQANVSSKLYKNESMTFMNIIKEYTGISSWNSSRSISLGPNNMAGDTPLSYGQNLGWYFKEYGEMNAEDNLNSLQRTWILNRHESGVFGTRHSFTRKKVKRWTWDDKAYCGEYRAVSEGYLDVGVLTEDFYILPAEMYSLDTMNTFIENYRPSLNTCERSVYNQGEQATDTIVNKDKTILYYYKQRELR